MLKSVKNEKRECFDKRKSLGFLSLQQRLSSNPDSFNTLIAFVKEVGSFRFIVVFAKKLRSSQVAERIITMKKMKQVVMRLFSTLESWLGGRSAANMGPSGIGKLLKNFCESVNKARDSVAQLKKADREASHLGQIAPPRCFPTQQKARGTSVQSESRPGSSALPLGLFSELAEKVSKVTPIKSEETEGVAKVNMERDTGGKEEGDHDIKMEASVEDLDLLLADFTIKSRERRRRRLR